MISNKKKKIIFVTTTRADFGKLKSLIKILKNRKEFEIYIVITGMHVIPKFGNTYLEVKKYFRSNISSSCVFLSEIHLQYLSLPVLH